MKSFIRSGIVLILAVVLFSCKKNTSDSGSATLIGKWHLVFDANFTGVSINNHLENYLGLSGDYFDFRSDGKLYSKEGIKMDTCSYQLTSDTTILIPTFGVTLNGITETSHITKLTASQLTIIAPTVGTPGGLFGRTVSLNR